MNDAEIVRQGIDDWCVTQSGDEISAAFERVAARLNEYHQALDKISRLGNEPMHGNSDGNMIAYYALHPSVIATPDLKGSNDE